MLSIVFYRNCCAAAGVHGQLPYLVNELGPSGISESFMALGVSVTVFGIRCLEIDESEAFLDFLQTKEFEIFHFIFTVI
jgi:hypothetical protein